MISTFSYFSYECYFTFHFTLLKRQKYCEVNQFYIIRKQKLNFTYFLKTHFNTLNFTKDICNKV